jgi:GNAT superfamily N-acetyltransferase
MTAAKVMPDIKELLILPLTTERWPDLETLFGPSGACMGCWCMWWRVRNKDFNQLGREGLKNGLRTLVHQGVEAGLIAYADATPAGWVTIAPRSQYVRLATSKLLAPVDDQPVWSMPCFFIHKSYRGKGLMRVLIQGAVDYARTHGATIIEVYPFESQSQTSTMNIYTGVVSAFRDLGFVEVERRKPNRPIMRKVL